MNIQYKNISARFIYNSIFRSINCSCSKMNLEPQTKTVKRELTFHALRCVLFPTGHLRPASDYGFSCGPQLSCRACPRLSGPRKISLPRKSVADSSVPRDRATSDHYLAIVGCSMLLALPHNIIYTYTVALYYILYYTQRTLLSYNSVISDRGLIIRAKVTLFHAWWRWHLVYWSRGSRMRENRRRYIGSAHRRAVIMPRISVYKTPSLHRVYVTQPNCHTVLYICISTPRTKKKSWNFTMHSLVPHEKVTFAKSFVQHPTHRQHCIYI